MVVGNTTIEKPREQWDEEERDNVLHKKAMFDYQEENKGRRLKAKG